MVVTRRGATNTTLAATQRHPCRSGMVTAGCARSRLRPESVWRLAALKDQQKIPALTISLTHSRARGADDGGRRRRDASYGVARDSHPVSTTAVRGALMASLAERSASPWTATSMRDRPAGCSTCASSLCGALCGNSDGRQRPASMVCWWRSDGGEDWRRAGDDGRNAPRRDQHDTRRHPATSVSFWDGDR